MKIALIYAGKEEKHKYYLEWLEGSPDVEVITVWPKKQHIAVALNCNAIVFSGGPDIHPHIYCSRELNYSRAPACFDEQRDEFELSLLEKVFVECKPILGVCRGMQIINCFLGGDLIQDLGLLNDRHLGHNIDKLHEISILSNTLLFGWVRTSKIVVPSSHHQAVNKLGEGLNVNCVSADGVVEGFEIYSKSGVPLGIATQWHPERLFKLRGGSSFANSVRENFISQIA